MVAGGDDFGAAVVVAGPEGAVWVAGGTTGDLGGPSSGSTDAFVTGFGTAPDGPWPDLPPLDSRSRCRGFGNEACGRIE